MDRADTARLLTVIAAYDHRTFTEPDVLAWHEALQDLGADPCREAITAHFRDSTEWLMPVHIRRIVRAVRQDTAMRQIPDSRELKTMPDWFKATVAQTRAERRSLNQQRAKTGHPPWYGSGDPPADDHGDLPW